MALEKLAKTLPSLGSLGLKGRHPLYSPRQETGESLAFGVQRVDSSCCVCVRRVEGRGQRSDGRHLAVCNHFCLLYLQEIGAQKDELSFEQFHLFYKKLMFDQQKSVRGLCLVFLSWAQS